MTIISGAISWLVQLFNKIVLGILAILPGSPFREMFSTLIRFEFLGYLNFFIPFDTCVGMLEMWSVCVMAFYAYTYARKGLQALGLLE